MAIAYLTLPSFPVFTFNDYTTISTCWKKQKRKFENLVIALNVTDDKQKKPLLLNQIGEEAYEVYENLTTGAEDESYKDVITSLDGHFAPKSNISYERYLFRNFKQNSDERIQQFYIRVKQRALKCEFGDTNNETKQQLILVTSSSKLRRYCFCNPEITLEIYELMQGLQRTQESQAEETEKISKDVEDVNLTKKSKKQSKTDERVKVVRILHRKHVLGVVVVILMRHNVQKQGKRVITTERCCRNKYRSNTGHGKSLNHLLSFLPFLTLNLTLIMKSLQYKLYFLKSLIIKKYLLRKTTQRSHLFKKLTMMKLLLRKLTLTSLFLTTILQHQYKFCQFLNEIQPWKEYLCNF